MENDVFVLILGATDGAYALAHAFFHDYGIRPTVMDEAASALLLRSVALTFEKVPGMAMSRMLLLAAERFYERHSGKPIFLLAAKKEYLSVVEENRETLEKMFFLPRLTAGDIPVAYPKGLLAVYRSTEGYGRSLYGKAAAWDEKGMPLLVLVEKKREKCQELLAKNGSIGLFAETEEGKFLPVDDPLSPLLFFLTAADVSLPEWLLADYLLCDMKEEADSEIYGMFSLFAYRRLRKKVISEALSEADSRYRRHEATALYLPKREKGLFRRFRYRTIVRQKYT